MQQVFVDGYGTLEDALALVRRLRGRASTAGTLLFRLPGAVSRQDLQRALTLTRLRPAYASAGASDGRADGVAHAGVGGAHTVGLRFGGELEEPLLAVGNHRGRRDAAQSAARQLERPPSAAGLLKAHARRRDAQASRLIPEDPVEQRDVEGAAVASSRGSRSSFGRQLLRCQRRVECAGASRLAP